MTPDFNKKSTFQPSWFLDKQIRKLTKLPNFERRIDEKDAAEFLALKKSYRLK